MAKLTNAVNGALFALTGFAISACCGSGCPGCPTFPGNIDEE